jgi:hypothetical protein
MYLTWTKSNAEAAMKQNALATKRHKKAQDRVDRRITPSLLFPLFLVPLCGLRNPC